MPTPADRFSVRSTDGSIRAHAVNRFACLWSHPALVWLVVLMVIFATETAVMIILPLALPSVPWLVQSSVDAVVLTVIVSPMLWWTIVRPLRQSMEIRTRYLASLVNRTEALRRKLAHELHDGVGQSVTLLVSGIRSLEKKRPADDASRRLNELQQIAQNALQDIRQMSLGLRPSLLDNLGLAPAIEEVAAQTSQHHAIEMSVDVGAIAGQRFSEAIETALFRILQEALQNIIKHSGANHASVRATLSGEGIGLTIDDDGCGLQASFRGIRRTAPDHLGLVGMQERAALLNGRFTIESRPEQGTRIKVFLPLAGRRATAAEPFGDHVL